MIDAPQQDWAAYERRCRQSDEEWLRGLTTDDRFDLYADLFRIVWDARRARGDWQRLDEWHWTRKVADRRRMVASLLKLDQFRRERAAGQYPG